MIFTSWIVTSRRRLDLIDVETLLSYREGSLPSVDDPEVFKIETDARGDPKTYIQPILEAQSMSRWRPTSSGSAGLLTGRPPSMPSSEAVPATASSLSIETEPSSKASIPPRSSPN